MKRSLVIVATLLLIIGAAATLIDESGILTDAIDQARPAAKAR